MTVKELLKVRALPGAGVYISVTRKCPLSCAHCVTDSSMTGGTELDEQKVLQFVRSMKSCPPKIIYLTGGEPLIKVSLVKNIISIAKELGIKVAISSGMFFAKNGNIPLDIKEILDRCDLLLASVDEYHEKEVPRDNVFQVLNQVHKEGTSIGIQTVSSFENDPYVDDLIEDAKKRLPGDTGILVAGMGAIGRASSWASDYWDNADAFPDVAPCQFATWPVVESDGIVFSCCSEEIVTMHEKAPDHLKLGSINDTFWPEIVNGLKTNPVLRLVRTYGPGFFNMEDREVKKSYCQICGTIQKELKVQSKREKMENEISDDFFNYFEKYIQKKMCEKKLPLVKEYNCYD